MTGTPFPHRLFPYIVAVSGGTIALGALFRSLIRAQSLAAMVVADLAGALLAIGIVYPFLCRAFPESAPELRLSPRALLIAMMSGLAIIVAVTIVSREWLLAIEALVFVSVVACALAVRVFRTARQQGVQSADEVRRGT